MSPKRSLGDIQCIVFAPFLIIIMAPKPSLGDITFAQFLIITSPRDVLLFYLSFSLLLLLFFFHTFLSARFIGDAWVKLYETL